jgi:predicted transport protein
MDDRIDVTQEDIEMIVEIKEEELGRKLTKEERAEVVYLVEHPFAMDGPSVRPARHAGDLSDDDEEVNEPTDRPYWENRASAKTVEMADAVAQLCRDFATDLELSFNKYYIGFRVDGKACNFAVSRPRKNAMQLCVRLPQTDEVDQELEQHGLELLDYDTRWKNYRIRLASAGEITKHAEFLKSFLKRGYDRRHAE